ncbi:hypothetical protein [Rhizobium sp.]|jgi:hypothetical protein|uniref:hypothetical protein n=1 Tax=Rhizobium sp. TaxID=391 RepID=UPI0028AE6EF9|nr:hypothetical protein [Nitrospira sp.]MCW5886488.1 hypothetical protein [Anaerolineales bacterium]
MKAPERSTTIAIAAADYRVTHLEIVCCGRAVYKRIEELPASVKGLTLEQIAPKLTCEVCGNRASVSRIGYWKHGQRRLPTE